MLLSFKEVLLAFTRDGKKLFGKCYTFYVISKQVVWNCFSLLRGVVEK